MEPTTWHILREDGTTVDITTTVQLTDALSTVADDESVNTQPKPFIVGDEALHEWGWFPGCDSFWSI